MAPLGEHDGSGPTRLWVGGGVAAAARALARTWRNPAPAEATIAKATEDFLRLAMNERGPKPPVWLNRVAQRLQPDAPFTTRALARELGMHAGWLAEACRAATGEGLHETVRRRRVEMATALLRHSNRRPADIAAEAGFRDQSHMLRAIRSILERTPTQIRAEWDRLHRPAPGSRVVASAIRFTLDEAGEVCEVTGRGARERTTFHRRVPHPHTIRRLSRRSSLLFSPAPQLPDRAPV